MDEHGNSPFCYTLYSTNEIEFSHHDRVPEDLVADIVLLLKTTTLNDIAFGKYHNFGGSEASSTHNGFNVSGTMYVNGNVGTGTSDNPQSVPDNNSLFRLTTNCKTDFITFESGSSLEIGSDNRGLKGEFVVRKGTTIIFEEGSSLIINDSSRLVIEADADMQFLTSNSIVLNGANAVLEIRGNLEILNNVTMNIIGGVKGLGKLVVNKNWRENRPDEIGGNGSFSFTGTSKNAPHIIVKGNSGLKFGYGIDTVTIKDMQILIDESSTLCFLNAFSLMNNVMVNPNGNYKHKGIKAVNRFVNFRNVDVNNAVTGITFFNNGYNGSPLLQNVNVSNSGVGVHALGCPIRYTKGSLEQIGYWGFLGNESSGYTRISGVDFTSDGITPVVFGPSGFAMSGGSGMLDRCKIENFNTGVDVSGSTLRMKCNLIKNNNSSDMGSQGRGIF